MKFKTAFNIGDVVLYYDGINKEIGKIIGIGITYTSDMGLSVEYNIYKYNNKEPYEKIDIFKWYEVIRKLNKRETNNVKRDSNSCY